MTNQERHALSYDMFVEVQKLISVFLAANAECKPKDLHQPILAGLVLATVHHACDKMGMDENEIGIKCAMAAALHQITKESLR
jgi:hypothetical protein